MRMLYCPIHGSFVGHEALSSIRCPIIVSEACCLLYVWPPASKEEAEYILILALCCRFFLNILIKYNFLCRCGLLG